MASDRLDLGMKCIKYMLFVANFMFVLVAFLLLSIGSTVKAIYRDFDDFMAGHYYSPSSLAIAVGLIIFVVAIVGCVGAVKESTCLVNFYAVLLTLVLVMEISLCIAAYAMRGSIEETIRFNMEEALDRYNEKGGYYQYGWNNTQELLHCCGIDGPDDWLPSNYASVLANNREDYMKNDNIPPNATTIPDSCCLDADCTNNNPFQHGCLDRLSYIVSECALLLAIGALCVSFIQILGIVFAHMLAKSIRKLKSQALVERETRRQQLYEQLAKQHVENEKTSTILFAAPGASEA